MMNVLYFRNVEGIHAFANDKTHREALELVQQGNQDPSAPEHLARDQRGPERELGEYLREFRTNQYRYVSKTP